MTCRPEETRGRGRGDVRCADERCEMDAGSRVAGHRRPTRHQRTLSLFLCLQLSGFGTTTGSSSVSGARRRARAQPHAGRHRTGPRPHRLGALTAGTPWPEKRAAKGPGSKVKGLSKFQGASAGTKTDDDETISRCTRDTHNASARPAWTQPYVRDRQM